jgi:16S rRNA (adenine1518-N6/adenine1519-N6)-dimethyltransferase
MRPIKRLSQHFLTDLYLVSRMVSHAGLEPSDVVLEIGPGKGIITEEIAKICRVIAVEKDGVLAELLEAKNIKNLEVIHGDILQKEFAQRFVAKPGTKEYSRLTLAVNYYCEPKILEKIPAGKFYPKPKVDAVLVMLKPKKRPFETDAKFWSLVSKLFQHKKKTIRASLLASKYAKSMVEKLPKELLEKRVVRCDIWDIKKVSEALF